MAGRGGVRSGSGRKPGTKNKATIERELAAARQLAETANAVPGRKLARMVLDDVMHVCYGLMAKHQPAQPGELLSHAGSVNQLADPTK